MKAVNISRLFTIRIALFIAILQFCVSWQPASQHYTRQYSKTGELKAEGWVKNEKKTGYWYYYHSNGAVSQKGGYVDGNRDGYWYYYKENSELVQEGHYEKGVKVKWWVIYNELQGRTEKYQYVNGLKDGYCFFYRGKKLFKAELYKKGARIKEWTNLASFLADNPNPKF